MYTEDEAKEKWCPEVRMVGVENGGNQVINKTSFNKCMSIDQHKAFSPAGSNCIGSECMKWRWVVDNQGNIKLKRTKPDETHAECNGKGCDNCDHHGHTGEFAPLGYCGAGGFPDEV